LKVFARFALSRGCLHAGESALLLEGQWPNEQWPNEQCPDSQSPAERLAAGRWSLDREIDSRHNWIDDRAAELAEHFAEAGHRHANAQAPGLAWLNVVKLRYLLVKLLRVAAFFDSHHRAMPPNVCQLFFEPGRDACYQHVLHALGRQHGFEVIAHPAACDPAAAGDLQPIARSASWRRAAERCVRQVQPALSADKPRVVLCGNPRLLAPVCGELLRRRMQPWWLVERFAPRSWLRWRRFGVGSLSCDDSCAEKSGSPHGPEQFAFDRRALPPLADAGWPAAELVVAAVAAWLHRLHGQLGARQARQSAQIERHLDFARPLHVVLDQDGSPFNRAVVAAARQRGVHTSVVQHGAPFIRFGFAPLAADRFCAWGETSRVQMLRWGVPRERIRVTGTAMALPPTRRGISARAGKRPRFVLLATLAPADSRPDGVNYHLTGGTFAAMLRGALAAVSNWPGASLLIKLHPRDPRSPAIRSIAAEFDRLDVKIVARGSLAGVLRGAHCVLSCASSAGIEAAACGWPVIQLMPEGSGELLAANAWGLVGTARTRPELAGLIERVLAGRHESPAATAASTIAATGREAASRIVDAILSRAVDREPGGQPARGSAETHCV
jgi:hypothetical protein